LPRYSVSKIEMGAMPSASKGGLGYIHSSFAEKTAIFEEKTGKRTHTELLYYLKELSLQAQRKTDNRRRNK
jgi:hypothetical protein